MKKQYVGIISSINDVKSRIIYDLMSAKEDERECRKDVNLYKDRRHSSYPGTVAHNHYRLLESIFSEKMWMAIGRQLNARSLWDTIVSSEKLSPPEPQSPEDFDFSHIEEDDIPFGNEGEEV